MPDYGWGQLGWGEGPYGAPGPGGFPAYKETLKDIRDRIRIRLQDPEKKFWMDSDLNQYINYACLDLQQETQWLEDWYGVVIQEGTSDYSRQTDIIQNMRYQVYDTTREDVLDIYMLDRFKPDWRSDEQTSPIRIYRKDWDTDTAYPTPSDNGDTFTFTQETGVVLSIQDVATNQYIGTFNSELGICVMAYDTVHDDDFLSLRLNPGDPDSDSEGEWQMVVSPYLNLINVFSRLPDLLTDDTQIVPFPIWSHYALEEFILWKCFSKEGDNRNEKLATAHKMAYQQVWLPFLQMMINSRTPDHPLIWRGQDPGDPHVANYSTVTPSYTAIAGR